LLQWICIPSDTFQKLITNTTCTTIRYPICVFLFWLLSRLWCVAEMLRQINFLQQARMSANLSVKDENRSMSKLTTCHFSLWSWYHKNKKKIICSLYCSQELRHQSLNRNEVWVGEFLNTAWWRHCYPVHATFMYINSSITTIIRALPEESWRLTQNYLLFMKIHFISSRVLKMQKSKLVMQKLLNPQNFYLMSFVSEK
jgi:hypothetical protein